MPGPGTALDIALLTLFAKRCKDVYGLNEDSLRVLLTPDKVALFTLRIAGALASMITLMVSFMSPFI